MVVMEQGGALVARARRGIRATAQRLHPWNRTTLMPLCAFEPATASHARDASSTHQRVDALSGNDST